MQKFQTHKGSGQVMVISLLLLSFLALVVLVVGLTSIIRESQSRFALENKALAAAAADACMEQAMNRLGMDELYAGDEVINVGDADCEIRPINFYGTSTWVIETSSQVYNQVARFRTTLSSRSPVLIDLWEEVDTF